MTRHLATVRSVFVSLAVAAIVPLVALLLTPLLARVDGQQPVVHVAVAAHALMRGAVITTDDITFKDTTARAAGDTSQVAPGWVARRMIAAGEALRSPAVEPPNVVVANQQVDVEWKDQNVSLIMRGTVTRSASLGERVTVRTESGRRIEGTVIGAGRVRID